MKSYKYLSFDCYGTLIDWERGILNFFSNIISEYDIKPREILTNYARFEASAEKGEYKSYRETLRLVYQQFSSHYGFEIERSKEYALADSVKIWPPFVDSHDALKKLQESYKLIIISNIDDELFAFSEKLLGIKFDHIFTAQQMQSYKPSTYNFTYVKDRLNLDNDNWLHVAQSLYHDHMPASTLGIDSVWIKRESAAGEQGVAPQVDILPERIYHSMEAFANDQVK